MKHIVPLICLLTLAAHAQYGEGFQPVDGSPGFGTPEAGMRPSFPVPEIAPKPESAAQTDGIQMSREGLSARSRNALTTSGVVSPVWAGSMSQMSFMQSGSTAMQFSTGYLAMTQGPASNLDGSGIFASVVPVFFGVRQNLAVTTTKNMEWTQYAVAGAGPLVGIEHPETASFWQTFSKMSFRWGAGAYAGLGSEMRFERGLGLYAQLELTGYGFTAPLLDRQSYLGPSFSFGILFFPQ